MTPACHVGSGGRKGTRGTAEDTRASVGDSHEAPGTGLGRGAGGAGGAGGAPSAVPNPSANPQPFRGETLWNKRVGRSAGMSASSHAAPTPRGAPQPRVTPPRQAAPPSSGRLPTRPVISCSRQKVPRGPRRNVGLGLQLGVCSGGDLGPARRPAHLGVAS